MAKYYASGSYDNQNETYILKTNGTWMNDGLSQEKRSNLIMCLTRWKKWEATISGPP